MEDFRNVCQQAAKAGGEVLRQWQGRIGVQEKAPKDLVTEADLESQKVIREILLEAFPSHDFLGEENLADSASPAADQRSNQPRYRWIVDPLDGTTNYVHRLPGFSVSVALERGGQLLVGTVFDPETEECFTAVRGEGADLNGERLRVSGCTQREQALVACSFSATVHRSSPEIARFVEALLECQALRRMGSAALNLAYLAAGRFDGYWATSVKPWDVAAGMLLVREAGGKVTDMEGGPVNLARPEFVAAATPELHQQLQEILARATK